MNNDVERALLEAATKVQEAIDAASRLPGHRAAMAKGQMEAAKEALSRAQSFIRGSGSWQAVRTSED